MKKQIKNRIPASIYNSMMEDLQRPHEYAYERIGFLYTKSKQVENDLTLITAFEYHPVDDEDYIKDDSVGARINSAAIRKAMQYALNKKCGVFHVHLHEHKGNTGPSFTDNEGIPPMIESFTNVSPNQVHGMMILSLDSMYVSVRTFDKKKYQLPTLTCVVGYPAKFFYGDPKLNAPTAIYDRQGFLGDFAQRDFENVRVGIVGYGGGGSHVGQQLAHLGFLNVTVFDDDVIEYSNLNRLVGGIFSDIAKKVKKTAIAKRIFKAISPKANVIQAGRWQNNAEKLQSCDFVIGCVDSYAEREQLEAECRRYLIPYIDIGMDVHSSGEVSTMSGQIILSMPGNMCMRCMQFLTEEKLAKEAAKYGNVGGRPQVVWPNGVLASTAVGILVDLVTGWSGHKDRNVYQSYDGNEGTISNHVRLNYADKNCDHYKLVDCGTPVFVKL